MIFNSLEFFIFLPIVLGAYWLLRRRNHQNLLLLMASYVFYGWWDYRFLSLIWISTIADFLIAQRLAVTSVESHRKRWLFGSLAVNLGILGFFKYFNFFVDSAADLLETIGLSANAPTLSIILPIGSASTPSRRSATPSTSSGVGSSPSETSLRSACMSRSSLNWWPGRLSAHNDSFRNSRLSGTAQSPWKFGAARG